ncbi:MAG: monovalent cation/H+ antiporter subunit D family protein [Parvibaculum sp.]|nr:monovalent cation/H+ antiporter subunit D family protein [Parvibaculum sp.]
MPQFIAQHLPILQVIVPLIAAPFCALISVRNGAWWLAFVTSLVTFAISVLLFAATFDGEIISYHLGGWAPPIGIEYRVDMLNAFVLTIVSGTGVLTLLYARASVAHEVDAKQHGLFYTAFVLCLTGLLGVTITGDAFNVFVFLEISSLATYAIVASGAKTDRRALTAAYNYLIMGTIGATFFVIGLGLLYMITGTLNMADLAQRLLEHGDSRTLRMGYAFILVGLGLKLAMFPLHQWLPNAYTYAPSAVSAFLSATATKVAIYVLLRFLFSVFGFSIPFEADILFLVVLPLALAGSLIGAYIATYQDNLKRLLAYSSISQIGAMLIGVSMLSASGLMAAIIHLFNHAVTKASLYMVAGAYAKEAGTVSIRELRGVGRDMPFTTAAFVVGGMSLIGIPLTVGFISKWYLVEAALMRGWWPVVIVIVVSSLIALIYVGKFIEAAYMHPAPQGIIRREAPLTMLIPMWIFAGLSLFFGINSSLTSEAAARAAQGLVAASSLIWQ